MYVKAVSLGYKDEDIKVTVEGFVLTLRAAAEEIEESDTKKKYYRKEIRIRLVVRSVNLPKAEEAKPKEISIIR